MGTKNEFPEGVDISYDIIRLLSKHQLTAKEAERILDKAKGYISKYARLDEK